MRRVVCDEDRYKIRLLHAQGVDSENIAERMGCSKRTVYRHIKEGSEKKGTLAYIYKEAMISLLSGELVDVNKLCHNSGLKLRKFRVMFLRDNAVDAFLNNVSLGIQRNIQAQHRHYDRRMAILKKYKQSVDRLIGWVHDGQETNMKAMIEFFKICAEYKKNY